MTVALAVVGAATGCGSAHHLSAPRQPLHRSVGATPPAAGDGPLEAASRFAIAWWSYDWQDPPGAMRRRVAALVTPALLDTLVDTAGTPVLDQVARSVHRRVAVGAPAVTTADRPAAGWGLAVTAPVTVTSATALPVRTRWAMEVLVVPLHRRWVVAEVEQ